MVSMSLATLAVLTYSAAWDVRFIDNSPNNSERAYACMSASEVLLINGEAPKLQ
jgi:hypothetical protein